VLHLVAYFVTTLAARVRSDQRRLEAMVEQAVTGRRLLEQALATTGAGICVLDADLSCQLSNELWKRWFGLSASEECCRPRELPGDVGLLAERTLGDGVTRHAEVSLSGPCEGEDASAACAGARVIQTTVASLGTGGAIRVVLLAQDVTQQKKAQAQVLQSAKLAAVGELAGHVAHEVNNPNAIISAKARLLLSDHRQGMTAKVAEDLQKIVDLSDRVARIAQGLLTYCRPSASARGPLDLRDAAAKALALVEPRAAAAGVEIVNALDPGLPRVAANGHEMEQVCLNLFLNAIDAMPRGGRLAVALGPGALGDGTSGVCLAVEDTGVGIPRENQRRIFDPFFTTKEQERGTGLGLSICMGLVRSHGGEIEVESEPGRGSRFTVRLPVDLRG